MRINTNIMALNAHRQLMINQGGASKSIEKLSSGLRINRAGDDAAGLAISEKMRGQIRGLNQASRNAQDAISLIQTAEGALNEIHAILQRMRELAVQASTDTNTPEDRIEIQKEINDLTSEINRIGNTTEFNTMSLLNGDRANTRQVTGMNYVGGTAKETNVGNTGLDVTLNSTNPLAAGSHTLDITMERNTRDVQTVTTSLSDFTGGDGVAKNVVFEGNAIAFDAAEGGASVEWTLTWKDDATFDAGGYFTLTNDVGAGNAGYVEDIVVVGQEYENHGLRFTIADKGNIAHDDDLIFEQDGAAAGTVGTVNSGWTGFALDLDDMPDNVTVELTDVQELSLAGGGKVTVTWVGADEITIVVKDANNNVLVNDTVNGATAYNAHGISINFDQQATAAMAGAQIEIDIDADTYTVQGSLNGDAAVDILTDYDGTSNVDLEGFDGIEGLTLDSKIALKAGSFDFEVEQTVTGEDNSLAFQIGANENQAMRLSVSDMRSVALGISSASGGAGFSTEKGVTDGTSAEVEEYSLDMSTHESAAAAVTTIDNAISTVSGERAKLGASQNRLEHTIANLGTSAENLQAAESRIRNVDMAAEMMAFTKFQILQQASTAMLAQANLAPQSVLQLLG